MSLRSDPRGDTDVKPARHLREDIKEEFCIVGRFFVATVNRIVLYVLICLVIAMFQKQKICLLGLFIVYDPVRKQAKRMMQRDKRMLDIQVLKLLDHCILTR